MEFKTKPFAHQLQVFKKIKDLPHYALFWEMGLGKTKMIIDLIRYKFQEHGEGKVIILCPKIVKQTWFKEFGVHSHMQDLVQVVGGSKQQKIEQLNAKDKLIFVVNYDSLRTPKKIKDDVAKAIKTIKDPFTEQILSTNWFIKVADESHRIKSHKSQRGKVSAAIKAHFSYISTGTAILKDYGDLQNQFLFLDKGELLGTNYNQFKYRYFIDLNAKWRHKEHYFPNWQINPLLEKQLLNLVASKSDRKIKDDCLDLPKKTFITMDLEMSKEQRTAYEHMKEELIHWIKENDEATVAKNLLTKTLRLMQISAGHMKTDLGNIIPFKENCKIDALHELLPEIVVTHKVVISCAFIQDIKTIAEEFKHLNPSFIHGSSDVEMNKKKFVEDPTSRILLAHPHSLIGINELVVADYMIYFSNNFSFEDRTQSRDRIHRPGQVNNCTFIDLVCSEIEDMVINKNLANKKMLLNNIMSHILK